MAGERAQIVGAAVTHVGKVREHNEDAHYLDADLGLFVVCDGMGGHAAGEVASALAIRTIRSRWSGEETLKVADHWLSRGTHDAKKAMLSIIRAGVVAAHDAILAEAARDEAKKGMGTTLVGAMIVGGDCVFAHAGDSRAYLVRDHIAMQLTEDHTLLARLTAAGIDVDVEGEGSRFKSMLTNALGIGTECRIATFVVPLADGDRFLLCSDGISEYVTEAEVGQVLTKQPSPARAAQKLVEMALERGGGDNATALVVRVLEAGETPQPAEQRRKDDDVIASCVLWTAKVTPQQRLRALRIAIPRDFVADDKLPAQTLGDRVAWIIVEGEVVVDGRAQPAGTLLYPECLIEGSQTPERDGLASAKGDVRALALRSDDFRELCEDDAELGEGLLEGLAELISRRSPTRVTKRVVGRDEGVDPRSTTDPGLAAVRVSPPIPEPPAKPSPELKPPPPIPKLPPLAKPDGKPAEAKPAEKPALKSVLPGADAKPRVEAKLEIMAEDIGPRKAVAPAASPKPSRPPTQPPEDDDSGVAAIIVAGPPIDSQLVSSSPLVESLLNLVDSGDPELDVAPDVLSFVDPPARGARAMTAEPHIETYELDPDTSVTRLPASSIQPEFEEEHIEPVSVEVDAVTMVRTLPVFADETPELDDADDDENPLPGETTLVIKLPTAAPDEPHAPKHTPITSEETSVASGTISSSEPRRAKRVTDGWNDD